MIRVVHPGSRIRMLTFSHPGSRIPDPEVKKALNSGSRIRIRNAEKKPLALQRDDPARQNMKFLHFFVSFPGIIRIRRTGFYLQFYNLGCTLLS
jgi:hypothetical protein